MTIDLLIKEHLNGVLLMMKEEIKEELKMELKVTTKSDDWMTRKEVSNYLKVCLATVDNLVKTGRLEKWKLNGSTKFKKKDLDKLLV